MCRKTLILVVIVVFVVFSWGCSFGSGSRSHGGHHHYPRATTYDYHPRMAHSRRSYRRHNVPRHHRSEGSRRHGDRSPRSHRRH